MHTWTWMLIILAVLLAAGLGALTWLGRKRPLALYAWSCRRALTKAGLRQHFVPSGQGPLSVFVGGTGPLLLLLHGAGDQAGTWAKVVPALLGGYRVILPDLAGHGDSAPASGTIEAAAIVAGLEAVIGAEAQGQPVTVIGNSLGGWMAMVLAQRHPEWVTRVIAVNGGALNGSASSVNLLPKSRREAQETMSQLRDPSNPAVPNFVLDDMVRRAQSSPLQRFVATANTTMGDWTLDEAELRSIQAPVTLLWGTADQLMTLGYAQRMASVLPHAELIPIARCGHIPQQEAPERFQETLLKVLGEAQV